VPSGKGHSLFEGSHSSSLSLAQCGLSNHGWHNFGIPCTPSCRRFRAMSCWAIDKGKLVLFGTYTIDDCIATCCTRDLDVVELWSGVGSVAAAGTEYGFSAAAFDLDRIPGITNVPGESLEDILTDTGFQKALDLVCRLREGGLLIEAPVCSSFVFPDSARTKRKTGHFTGDETYVPVMQGNLGAHIAVFLLLVAMGRQCHGLLENPAGSTLWSYIRQFTRALQKLPSVIVERCSFDTSPYPRLFKKYKISGTGAWIRRLARPCQCPDNVHQHSMYDANTGRTGNVSLLKKSASYPPAMGMHIISVWESSSGIDAGLVRDCGEAVWQGGAVEETPLTDTVLGSDPWADTVLGSDPCGEAVWQGGAVEETPLKDTSVFDVFDPWADTVPVSGKRRRGQSQGHSSSSAALDPWDGCSVTGALDPWG